MMKVMQTRPVPEMQATGTKIDKSRMMGDYQVRFCERVRLKCRALLDPYPHSNRRIAFLSDKIIQARRRQKNVAY